MTPTYKHFFRPYHILCETPTLDNCHDQASSLFDPSMKRARKMVAHRA